jgi:hypothetical protein
MYSGPHSDWLRDILERLPRLQSLIVNGIPFIDHASLLTLRHWSLSTHVQWSNPFPTFGLRFLDASSCSNATSSGLAEALLHLPGLLYLDLSRTTAAKDVGVFNSLHALSVLRVLKMAGLGLRAEDIETIARVIGRKVQSLDLRNNHLTDKAVRHLLDFCFLDASSSSSSGPNNYERAELVAYENSLFISRRGTQLDHFLKRELTRGFLGQFSFENIYELGLTDLYLSGNEITVEGVSGLLRPGRLRVLDIGIVARAFRRPRSLSQMSLSDEKEEDFSLPGAEKLVGILRDCASQTLTYFRISHSIITSDTENLPSNVFEMEGDVGKYYPANAVEMDGAPLVHEMPTDTEVVELPADSSFPAELPGSPVRITLTPAQMTVPHESNGLEPIASETTADPPKVRRESPRALEAGDTTSILDNSAPLLSPTSLPSLLLPTAAGNLQASSSPSSPSSPTVPPSPSTQSLPPAKSPSSAELRRINSIQAMDRRARLDIRQKNENCLHPGMLPKLRVLVLTDIPLRTSTPIVSDRLIQFVKDCAEESEIAKLQSKSAYALTPGRSRAIAEKEYAASQFGLRRIVLETAPSKNSSSNDKTSISTKQKYQTKSSTEDEDSEAFWAAAESDFSFFTEDDRHCPSNESAQHFFSTSSNDRITVFSPAASPSFPNSTWQGSMQSPLSPSFPQTQIQQLKPILSHDTIAAIASFRKERKTAYEAALKTGESPDETVDGYWPGDITVIRDPGAGENSRGRFDYYGNYFENGYYYR